MAALALWPACSVPAANIVWVAEANVDAAGVPYDQGWIDLLTAQGHTVDDQRGSWMTLGAAQIAALEAADLVIVSRTTNSGNYATDTAEVTQWNSVTTPLMLLSGYSARNSRWQWINSGSTTEYAAATAMRVIDGDHPIFTGVNTASGQVDVIDTSVNSGQATFIPFAEAGNGTLLATRLDDGNIWIVEWAPGTVFYSATTQVAAGKRMLFSGAGGGGGQTAGSMNFTPDGQKIFLNAVSYLLGLDLNPGRASTPVPTGGQTDVPRDVVFRWTPGEMAVTHDVYLGTTFADVNDASRANPLDVLVSQGQTAAAFSPLAGLEFGQVYYWRVDEWEADGVTMHKGNVWSFEVEPLAYLVTEITATASLPSSEDMSPNKTIDRSGLNDQGLYSNGDGLSWQVEPGEGDVVWIQYDFDRVYKLAEVHVWNHNFVYEFILKFGLKDVSVEYAVDANEWTMLGDFQLGQATSLSTYAGQVLDLGGVAAKSIRITANSNYGGDQYALGEVQFRYIPAHPREPQPAVGATGVSVDAVLAWRSGREAATHEVSFGTDANAVANGEVLVDVVTTASFDPGALNLGTTYYWKVDEVNKAATPSVWPSDVWSFTTREFLSIDDFESYTDNDNDGSRIFDAWLDGYLDTQNGSIVGNEDKPYAERTVVRSGKQAMILSYTNTGSVAYSEAELPLSPARDLTANGAEVLRLYHRGVPVGLVIASDSHIVMNGIGADIWNAADEGRFVYKTLNGNGTIVAKVDSIDNTDVWAKAGVMIRQSLDADSAWAYGLISAASGAHYQARLTAATAAVSDTSLTLPAEQTAVRAPAWVKLERIGNQFNMYYATDEAGTNWVANPWNPQTIAMTGPVYIGLAVTSHDAAEVTQTELSGIATTGNVTGQWQSVSLGVDQPAGNGIDRFYLAVEDSAGKKATFVNSSPAALGGAVYKPWDIAVSDITAAGVNAKSIKKLYIGVGDKVQPSKNASGVLYIDDIGYGRPIRAE
jgi:hypothetical protein